MWLLSTFFLAAVFSCGSAQDLQQTPISVTKPEGKTVLINCHVSNPNFINIFIHWYQKKANEAPKRVGYISSRAILENQSDERKFTIEKDLSKSVCTLTVSKITLQDSATYYCARLTGASEAFLSQVSVTRGHTATALIDCIAKGISGFQYVCKHWYRHVPSRAPERILYIGTRSASCGDDFYKNNYSLKKGTNVCTFTINDIKSNHEGLICTGSMLLLPVLLATSFWSCGDMQSVPVQTPEVHHEMKGKSASISCRLTNKDIVHWYKQLPGEPLKRILYLSGHTTAFDDNNDRNKFEVQKDPTQPLYGLTINSLTPRDAGTYYCAYWLTATVLVDQR